MSAPNFDWMDVEHSYRHRSKFGHARHELRLAEETFVPDIDNNLLLRLFIFIRERSSEAPLWEVVLANTTDLLLRRMAGGPRLTPLQYARGFDPEDSEKLLEAIRAGVLSSIDLLEYYQVALTNCNADDNLVFSYWDQAGWRSVVPIIRKQIMGRLRAGTDQFSQDKCEVEFDE
jgi:hypothetical protein